MEVTPVEFNELASAKVSETSQSIRQRVIKARNMQEQRFVDSKLIHCNAQMGTKTVLEVCAISEEGKLLLKRAMEKLGLSARAYDRILKLARTIADMEQAEHIENHHLAEAIHFRSLDRENWAE